MSLLAANLYVLLSARPHLYDVGDVPARTWAVVPGALVRDGWPGLVVQRRLAPAAALFAAGRVQKVLVSGKHDGSYNEPAAMRAWLVDNGVPEAQIVEDGAGWRTFLTARNAREQLGIRDAIVVTTEFHLARSVFLLRRFGIDAVGVPATPGTYGRWTRLKWQTREVAARGRAVWDVSMPS